eukprot:scaffold3.g6496.t1
MSWIPASGGLREPTTHGPPSVAAAAPTLSFGKAQAAEMAAAAAELQRGRANHDPPAQALKWWQQPRSLATVSGAAASDVEAFWAQAARDPAKVEELVNRAARETNREVGKGASMVLGDREAYRLADAVPSYREDFCASHERVGRRAVRLPAQAMQACLESKLQAKKNKQTGSGSNLKLAQFD